MKIPVRTVTASPYLPKRRVERSKLLMRSSTFASCCAVAGWLAGVVSIGGVSRAGVEFVVGPMFSLVGGSSFMGHSRCCVPYFGRKMLVFEVWRVNQFEHRIAEKERILAVVKAEAHFVQIGWKMFRRDFMPRAHNAALEQRESRFHGICVNIAMGVFPRVIDGLVKVLLHLVESVWIDSRFVGHNHFYMSIFKDYLLVIRMGVAGLTQWGSSWWRERAYGRVFVPVKTTGMQKSQKNCGKVWKKSPHRSASLTAGSFRVTRKMATRRTYFR